MRSLRSLGVRLAGVFRRSRSEREFNEEIQSNLNLHIEDNLRSGMTGDQARRAALLKFGSIDGTTEAWRDRRSLAVLETLIRDVKYALRTLRATPGFSAIAIVTLALGIGANTAMFTLVNAVLIERLPFHDPDRLVIVWENNARRPGKPNVVGPHDYIRWNERATIFERMSAFYESRVNLTGENEPEQLIAQNVTSDFFSTIGVTAMLGRTFASEEGPPGHDTVVILGNGLWKRRFASDPSIVGRSIQLNGRAFTVIGVMPPDIGLFVKAGSLVGKPAELWTPFAFTEAMRQPVGRYLTAIARLKAGVSMTEAQAQMDTIAAGLAKEFPGNSDWGVRLASLRDELSGEVRPALVILTGAVAFVLLIACANVANLLLARGSSRRREIAIRTALGAARHRIFRQLLTESILLSLLGGIAGLIMARWSLTLLIAISPVDITRMGHIELSWLVLGFTALVSCLTAVVSGFVPAFETAHIDVQESLKEGGRLGGGGVRSRWLRQAFVVGQVAISVVLLAGAGLMLRSFANLRAVDPGFNFHNVLTFRVTLPVASYTNPPRVVQFYRQFLDSVRALPGVRAAGEISYLPLSGTGAATGFTIVGQAAPEPAKEPVCDVRIVDNGYFQTMSVPLLKGRLFSDREMQERSDVVIVSETLARQYFPDEDPVGKSLIIHMSQPPGPTEIIGVVGDAKYADLTTSSRPLTYWPHPQLVMSAMTLTVRTDSDPMAIAPLVARALRSIDEDLPLSEVRTMEQFVDAALAQARFSSTLLTGFAALALLLAAIGIYGVMSYTVNQRTAEIAVRLALGADRSGILRLIVRTGLLLLLLGLALGISLAMLLNRTLTGLLYNTTGSDPAVFAIVVGVLGSVAILASYLPARRAARTMPVEALRHQ